MPPVSFVVPTYNRAALLSEALNSIVNGNFREGDEIIVCDDCSTDETVALLTQLSSGVPFLKFIRHEQNRGGGAARNSAVRLASHRLIFNLDSDNVLPPNLIPFLVDWAQNNPDYDVYSPYSAVMFYEQSEVEPLIGSVEAGKSVAMYPLDRHTFQLADIFTCDHTPGNGGNYLYTRQSWERAGGYPEEFGALDTWCFAVAQAATGGVLASVPGTYYFHRLHTAERAKSYYSEYIERTNASREARVFLERYRDRFTDEFWTYITETDPDGWYLRRKSCPIASITR